MAQFNVLAEETQPPTEDEPVKVRSLRVRDWRVVTHLLASTFQDLDPVWLARELRNAPHRFAVAVTSAGVSGVMRLSLDLGTRSMELDLLAVQASARGRGVAAAMLRYAQDVARACGTPELMMALDTGHPAAQALLARTGWVASAGDARTDASRTLWTRTVAESAWPDWRLRREHAPRAPLGLIGRTARRALYGAWLAAA